MSLTDIVNQSINEFCSQLTTSVSTLEDAEGTVRIIGEFSAGKTRFVRELFGDMVPQELLPISAKQRETYIPLEITFGEQPRLVLVEKSEGSSKVHEIKQISRFPERSLETEQVVDGIALKQGIHSFRLEIPEPRFILPEGDGSVEDGSPARFSLIDMPGWNSGNSILEENPENEMIGDWNIAIVYVANVTSLGTEHAGNKKHLEKIIQLLSENIFSFKNQKPVLYYLITRCPENERAKFVARETEGVSSIFSNFGMNESDYVLHVKAYELKNMTPKEKENMRNHFWNSILDNKVNDAHADIAATINRWSQEWDIARRLEKANSLLDKAKKVTDAIKRKGKYAELINNSRLLELNAKEREEKIIRLWQQQLGFSLPINLSTAELELPEGHPLLAWWSRYYMAGLLKILRPITQFFEKEERLLRKLPQDLEDIETYLSAELDREYEAIRRNLTSNFTIMMKCASQMVNEPKAVTVATMLALSLMDARYTDYLHEI